MNAKQVEAPGVGSINNGHLIHDFGAPLDPTLSSSVPGTLSFSGVTAQGVGYTGVTVLSLGSTAP